MRHIENDIKKIVYSNLHTIVPNLTDTPPEKVTKTYVLYGISDAFDTNIKLLNKQSNLYLTFDIFSTYDGEKEVIDIKNKIDDQMYQLYNLGEIDYFTMTGFNILNDERPIKKHGVLRYRILATLINDNN